MRRRGKQLIVEAGGELALLMHLMSSGRLQLFDKRAGPRDRTSRLLVRIADGRELRLREFGTKQAAWAKLVPLESLEAEESLARLGPEAWPSAPADLGERLEGARPLHAALRDQHVIAGIGRSWVDEILWSAELSPFKRGGDLEPEELERLAAAIETTLDGGARALRAGDRAADPRQAADAARGAPPRGRAVPALRRDARRGQLRGLRDDLLPGRARPTVACSRTAGSRAC